MGTEYKGQPGHSAEYFGDLRDNWWNADFLELDTIGLVQLRSVPGPQYVVPKRSQIYLSYFGQTHTFSFREGELTEKPKDIPTSRLKLTSVGQELKRIAGAIPNDAYRLAVIELMARAGWELSETTE